MPAQDHSIFINGLTTRRTIRRCRSLLVIQALPCSRTCGGVTIWPPVALLRTIGGHDFQTEIPPAMIAVSGVPSGFALSGLAFGPGTNTFWGKTVNNQLRSEE